jgi:hypothetical protein
MGNDTVDTRVEDSHQTVDAAEDGTASLPVHQIPTATSIDYKNEKVIFSVVLSQVFLTFILV